MNGKIRLVHSREENTEAHDARGVADVLHEMKEEAQQFVQTRFQLLKSELQEKLPNLKVASMLGVVGALLLYTSYLLLTLALVALVGVLFNGSEYRWVFAFLSVGVLWLILGGLSLFIASREFAVKGLLPKRTIAVLKGDKIWLEREAKTQL